MIDETNRRRIELGSRALEPSPKYIFKIPIGIEQWFPLLILIHFEDRYTDAAGLITRSRIMVPAR